MSDIVALLKKHHDLFNALDNEDWISLADEYMREAAAEIERLRAREKDLTLEWLSLIGRLEAVRDALAGTDIGSLPNDYPTQKMAQDRMDELATLRADNERLRAAVNAANTLMPIVYKLTADWPDEVLRLWRIYDRANAALTQSEEVKG